MKDKVSIRVSGAVIDELSDKISSNYVALSELIKNAYDADAENVEVIFDEINCKIIIKDDGLGMEQYQIEKLLHIAKSNKNYGEIRSNGRIVQGAKGLGAMSAFKFGNLVKWETTTIKREMRKFILDKNQMIEAEDIPEFSIDVIVNEDTSRKHGTIIHISVNEDEYMYLENYFKEPKIAEKIVNNFITIKDNNDILDINVKMIIADKTYSTANKNDFKNVYKDKQIFNIIYDSENEKIKFYYKKHFVFEEKYAFDLSDFTCKLDIMSYDFTGGRPKDFPPLHIQPTKNDEVTPLLYLNQNLLNNYDYFDPEIRRKSRGGSSFPQLTGYIEIQSSSKNIIFNPDRSALIENSTSNDIKEFLYGINNKIQELGSKNKSFFVPTPSRKLIIKEVKKNIFGLNKKEIDNYAKQNIETNNLFHDEVSYRTEKNRIVYNFFGDEFCVTLVNEVTKLPDSDKNKDSSVLNDKSKEKSNVRPFINLNKKKDYISIPSKVINLYGYIKSAKDSNGKDIPNNAIYVEDDKGIIKQSPFLHGIKEPTEILITYSYNDATVGPTYEELKLSFNSTTHKIEANNHKQKLIAIPATKNYKINISSVENRLVNEMNTLYEMNSEEYNSVISCSLRTVYELGVKAIRDSGNPDLLTLINQININKKNSLGKNVDIIVRFCKNEGKRKLSKKLQESELSYKTFKNRIESIDFEKAVNLLHIGAHASNLYLSSNDISDAGMKLGFYLVLINELLK